MLPAQLLLQLLLALRVCVAILLLQDCIKHSRSLRDGLPVSEKPLRGELLPMYAAHVCVALPIRLNPRVSKEYRLTHLLYHQVPKFSPYMAQCPVHALKGLAVRLSLQLARLRSTRAAAPGLLAHAEVTTTELK